VTGTATSRKTGGLPYFRTLCYFAIMIMNGYLVDLEPVGRRVRVEAGDTLLDAAQRAGVDLAAVCGGIGICGSCRVRLARGSLSALTASEEENLDAGQIARGYRLACQAQPLSDVTIDIPPESLPAAQQMQVEGQETAVAIDPAVIPFELQLAAPSLGDLRSDLTRANHAVSGPVQPECADSGQLRSAPVSSGQLRSRTTGVFQEQPECSKYNRGVPSTTGVFQEQPVCSDSGQLRPNTTGVFQEQPECTETAKGYAPLQGNLDGLEAFSRKIREQDWQARLAIRPGNNSTYLVGTFPPGTRLLGLAVDVGSTKLALYLVDLHSGATLAQSGVMNPQIAFGEDVISRIAFANKGEENRHLLQTRLVETLNQTVGELCSRAGASREQIVDAVLVGNTVMHHFLCGLPVSQLGAAPYIPAVSEPLDFLAREIGLQLAACAWAHLPANIAGYVGADHTAALLTVQAYAGDRRLVLVDIGTNTEISLVTSHGIFSCSTASGPAFEGAHIRDGMRAAPGAIERVRITGEEVRVNTVGGQPPVGICGTGILKAIAEMLEVGVLDRRGNLRKDDRRVRVVDGKPAFVLVPAAQSGNGREIVITRKDVNEIQLAKGAIRTGIEVLLNEAGVGAGAVDEWIVAGAFGTYLDLGSAQRTGLFPTQPLERFRQVGNAAGMGAKQMLISRHKREEASRLARQVQYIELTVYPNFTEKFLEAMYF